LPGDGQTTACLRPFDLRLFALKTCLLNQGSVIIGGDYWLANQAAAVEEIAPMEMPVLVTVEAAAMEMLVLVAVEVAAMEMPALVIEVDYF